MLNGTQMFIYLLLILVRHYELFDVLIPSTIRLMEGNSGRTMTNSEIEFLAVIWR